MMELYFAIKTIGTIAGLAILVAFVLVMLWMSHK